MQTVLPRLAGGSISAEASATVMGPQLPCKHSFTSEPTFKLITHATYAPYGFFIGNTEPEARD